MNKRFIACLLTLLLLAFAFAGAEELPNLVQNGDFSTLDFNGNPIGWTPDAWNTAHSELSVTDMPDGTRAAYVKNLFENDARWIQLISVEPDTSYVIRYRVMAEGIDGGQGANVSIMNTFTYSESHYDTGGEWVYGALYGKTGRDQNTIELALRVGGYNQVSAGQAWFSDISVTKEDTPVGFHALSLATLEPADYSNEPALPWESGAPVRRTEAIALAGFAVLLIGFALITGGRRIKAREAEPCAYGEFNPLIILGVALFAALALRAVIAVKIYGYSVDINCFLSWSNTMREHGVNFYEKAGFCDYPPAYMLWLGVIGWLRTLFAGGSADLLLIKLTPILCDIALAALAYFALEKHFGWRRALLGACAIAFNPALITNSAAWGQVDSVLTLLLALTVLFAARGKWLFALPVYALAVLTKPQALLFGPLGLTALLIDAYKRRGDARALRNMIFGLIGSIALVYTVSLPFAIAGLSEPPGLFKALASPFAFLKTLYADTAAGYTCLTINACNLYELLGMNWVNLSTNINMSALAWILFAFSFIAVIVLYAFSRDKRRLPMLGALLLYLVFCFGPMMHERYLMPALALIILAYAYERDWRLLIVLAIATCAQFLNVALVLQGGLVAEYAQYGHLQSNEAWINHAVSALNIAGALLLLWTAADICVFKRAVPLPDAKRAQPAPGYRLAKPRDYKLHMRARDYALMSAITLAYAVLAFVNLGDTQAPETEYTSAGGEQVVFDLGETRSFRLTCFGGIASSMFTVALSNDGVNWTEENYAPYSEGNMFQWIWYAPSTYDGSRFYTIYESDHDKYVREDTGEGGARVSYARVNVPFPTQTARYVRITTVGWQLKMREFGFLDIETGETYPIAGVSGSKPGADYTALTDEQHKVAAIPSYMNSMYFDEIYHARTAYEFANEYPNIFETSHPHLGKILIMLSVKLFGMTPFGWRFAGTLAGVFMLPVMYLMVKQLTKRTDLSFIAMFLLSVDSMHFTQTRIATIDSFAVLFIMTMYLFMFRYMQMSMHKQPLWKTLVPLGLSGLFMGFACAAKWIGIYASLGLAALFFITIIARLNEYLYARRALKRGMEIDLEASVYIMRCPSRLLLTLLFCVLAFIAVPLVIYYYSYYYHFAHTASGFNVKTVWEQQLGMFNYHSGVTDSHYFQSPWYEWPLIVKPMWYFDSHVAYLGYGVVSSISCMGNPAVWWVGLFAIICVYIRLCVSARPGQNYMIAGIGFASQFLPWLLISRPTFIYHYFASVPFIIIATVLMLNEIRKADAFVFKLTAGAISVFALILFIAFYPLESGMPCAYSYAELLRWFDWYNFAPQ